MNCAHEWSNSVYVDEVSQSECQKLCRLLEAIFAQAVGREVYNLCKERCCGCEYDHPSQRRHECLMLTHEEKWEMYGFEAIERVNSKREVWGEFVEAARVLKLKYHPDAHSHLRHLEKEPDSQFIDDLMELYLKPEKPEFETILNYLLHWREGKREITISDEDKIKTMREYGCDWV